MKIQILWAAPAERRFGSGDVLDEAKQKEFGLNAAELIAAGEAQAIETKPAPAAKGKKG